MREPPVNRRVRTVASASLLAFGLLFGLASCASTESTVKGSTPPEIAAREGAGQLQNCPANRADCDGSAANACEARLANDPKNCGTCGVDCAAANGESSCFGGTCRMVSCIPGHCDLDGDPKNGCEARTKGCRVNRG